MDRVDAERRAALREIPSLDAWLRSVELDALPRSAVLRCARALLEELRRDAQEGRFEAGAVQQMFSSLSEDHVSRRAHKQLSANLRLQLPDLHANCGLRYMNSCCGGSERACFSNRHESFQLSDFQVPAPDITTNYRNNKIF